MTGPKKNHSAPRVRLNSQLTVRKSGNYYAQISHVLCCKLHTALISSTGVFATNVNVT